MPQSPQTRIILIEDNCEYTEVIRLALEEEHDLQLIASFRTCEVALRHIQDASKLQPHIILLDLRLPGMNGLEAIPYIQKYSPNAKILVLTQSDDQADILEAIERGATGYLLKSSTLEKITSAIRTIANGGASIDPQMARYILNKIRKRPLQTTDYENALSKRETEVLKLLSQGLLKKQISDRLGISTATVSTHVSHIYEKFEVKNAPSAVTTAYQAGILPIID